MVKIIYDDEGAIEEEDLSLSLLDISLKHGIPHFHTCGRGAKCSLCQVEILANMENVLPRNPIEAEFARANGLKENIRLACQSYLNGPVTLRRLIRDETTVETVTDESFQFTGNEMNLAILFSDIRDFTPLAERMQPYDIFHVLNRYYQGMGEAVLRNHGYLHQYFGDGLMALFGFYARASERICLDAVTAGLEMLEELQSFNQYLRRNFGEKIHIGIGIHFGSVLAGKMGHPKHKHLTVMGDVVNTANRIEKVTKSTNYPLVISDSVYWELGATVVKARPFTARLKGKIGQHRLYAVTGFAPGFEKAREVAAQRRIQ